MSDSKARQKEHEALIAAIGTEHFKTLLWTHHMSKNTIKILENKHATKEWATIIRQHTSNNVINFGRGNYIQQLITSNKSRDLEEICSTISGNTLMLFDIPAHPTLIKAIEKGAPKNTLNHWLNIPKWIFTDKTNNTTEQQIYNIQHENTTKDLQTILAAYVRSGWKLNLVEIASLREYAFKSKEWIPDNAIILKEIISRDNFEYFVEQYAQNWTGTAKKEVEEKFIIPMYQALEVTPSTAAVEHFQGVLSLTQEAARLKDEKTASSIEIF